MKNWKPGEMAKYGEITVTIIRINKNGTARVGFWGRGEVRLSATVRLSELIGTK